MKSVILVLVFLSAYLNSHGQNGNVALDAMSLNSDIIAQGTVIGKYCVPQRDVYSCSVNWCVFQLKILNILKGDPKLSVLEAQVHIVSSPGETITTIDTLLGLCFEHIYPIDFSRLQQADSIIIDDLDYNFKIGDEVIVFLNEIQNSDLSSKLRIPEDWFVYSLADELLGVLNTRDYIIKYLTNSIKKN